MLPQTGKLVDRFGPRRMLMAIIGLLGLACLFFGAASGLLWLAVGFALLRFFGQGSVMLGCANMVSQWFSRSRGLAMSLMALGFGVSMAIHPPLSQALVEAYGWRQAWVVLGVLTWLLMLPVVIFLVHDKPEDLDLHPDGIDENAGAEGGENGAAKAKITGLTLQEALRHSSFYILSIGFFSISMLVTTLHFYQVTILTAQGVSAELSARVFPISAVTMVACMPLVGRLLDRVKTRYVIGLGLLNTGTSLVAVTFAGDTVSTIVYALIFGLNNAFSMTLFGYIWARYFGRLHLGSVQGLGQLIAVIGASLGPLPVGLAFDYLGDPTWTIRILAIYPVIMAAVAAAFLRTAPGVTGEEHLE